MQTKTGSQEEAVKNMADSYIRQSEDHFHIKLSRGPAAVEWMATQIPRVRMFDDITKEGIALAMGSLLGESIVTSYGGKWNFDKREWGVHLPSGAIVYPVEMVRTQMRGGVSIHSAFLSLGRKSWISVDTRDRTLAKFAQVSLLLPMMTCILLALAGGCNFVRYTISGRPFSTELSETESNPLVLYGLRGQTVEFSIRRAGSTADYATPAGLNLHWIDPVNKQEALSPVHPPVAFKENDSAPDSNRRNRYFPVHCSFTLPNLPGEGTHILVGRITGQLDVPGEQFDLNLPVTVEVASEDLHHQLWWQYEGTHLLVGLSSMVLIILGIFPTNRADRYSRQNIPLASDRRLLASIFLYLGLFVFLVIQFSSAVGLVVSAVFS